MNVLVTGNKGYIGSVLVKLLTDLGYNIRGYDIGYFEDCILYPSYENYVHIKKDIRDINKNDLEKIDVIIHLAGL